MRKKKVLISIIFIILFAILGSSCNNTENKQKKINKKQETQIKTQEKNDSTVEKEKEPEANEGLPEKKDKIIVIDPGHGNRSNLDKEPISPGSSTMKIKDGGGALGVVTKTPEYTINLKVGLVLRDILKQRGYTVVMTKTEPSQSPGNVERAEVGNNAKADLVLRIHADSTNDSSVKGASMLIPAQISDETKKIYNESKRCGNIIINKVTSEVGMKNRGVVERNDMTGFNWSKVPVVLIEMGFLSNSDEDKLLSSEDYDKKLATSLADGIDACFH